MRQHLWRRYVRCEGDGTALAAQSQSQSQSQMQTQTQTQTQMPDARRRLCVSAETVRRFKLPQAATTTATALAIM
jgi:hypothetical protein